jgi:hypothetical protein
MCDYSLHQVQSRAAKVGDKLTTRNFGTGTRGFAAPESPVTAVCILPGTELAFSEDVACVTNGPHSEARKVCFKTAVFRQVNKDILRVHHDALEFPDGQIVLLTDLCDGQSAVVLQLPARPTTEAEAKSQERAEYVG